VGEKALITQVAGSNPASCNHPYAADRDRRYLRRYRRRWIVKRAIARVDNFGRLTLHYDRVMVGHRGFFHPASALLVLRRVVRRVPISIFPLGS